ncbi:MAG TPA: DUF6231 family protein [Steroidobacteraceae bacterium]|nr:DUF6231 family protein [Steroidobacteraceae bacterium]
MNRRDWLGALLAERPARRLLALRHAGPLPALANLLEPSGVDALWIDGAEDPSALAPVGRHDLAVVIDQLEFMAAPARRHLLVRLRDLHARSVAVCVSESVATEWPLAEWRALQFVPGEPLDEEGQRYFTFEFDLATYNPERSWNTPEHWANPANFDRYRW